jgi:RND family efflux transporter MFP subunit
MTRRPAFARAARVALAEQLAAAKLVTAFLAISLLIITASGPAALAATTPFPTQKLTYRAAQLGYSSEATVEAVRQSTVAAQVSGRVVAVNVDAGDTVQKGSVIVRLAAAELGAAVAGSQAQVAQATATLENARANYARQQELRRQNFISQAALDRATAEFRAAEAAARAARAGVGQSAALSGYTTITAPFSGVVAARHVEVGETVAPGKPLMTGFDPADLRVVASIPQARLAEVRASGTASVEFPALGRWVHGAAVTVLPTADAATHTVQVRITLPPDTAGVLPGMFARAHFASGGAKKLLLPAAAIVRRSELTGVYVVGKNGQPVLRQIRVGTPSPTGEVELLAGAVAGETIALDPVKAAIRLKQLANKQPAK